MSDDYKYSHGFIVGRFQPFHNGHIDLIEKMASECNKCTIVIGSSQAYGTDRNPFRFRERKAMIKNWLTTSDLKSRIKIAAQVDTDDYYGWGKTVLDTISDLYEEPVKVEAFYCGLGFDSQYYYPDIKNIEILDRTNPKKTHISGTLIREFCTFQDNRWRELVPPSSVSYLESLMRKFYYDGLAK